uniref:MFS transporter, PAT family, beta-lactamase induction signal transducer AmpG n=1 Tax=Candidatus Kentrum eta TaxID=2126337 RepID=A0A450V5I4_9GAMM|nr:MAG: MFS transporter, PAT family, beta-lactamase induction signal transducer AmpG [Candidatus Kentron sp. H]VFJ93204.1 MAG: MFS transporter, PAT family, beta-lactamase induction signal transducer AmpG [Candidatus Kentron sp. H]VFK00054.1 MAG: MFS transporter, PAT family, beta-lactamase induction signal transducer AmpG [Candidatus Kentron sp. H]
MGSVVGRADPDKPGFLSTLESYGHPRVLALFFFGFSCGLPLLLIFSSLSLWLREAEIQRATVTYFSWAALGYSFKFIWAPLIDRLPLPWLTRRLGRRRGWLLLAQLGVVAAIVWMALSDPSKSLTGMALAAVLLGLLGATQDIVVDAYRIESADESLQALMASTYIAGYRVGMLAAGAGTLKLAAWFGGEGYAYDAWRDAYLCMALLMGVGIATTLAVREPAPQPRPNAYPAHTGDYLGFLALFLLVAGAFGMAFWGSGRLLPVVFPVLATPDASLPVGFFGKGLQLALAVALALGVARFAVARGLARREMARESYIEPIADFFRRYGRAAIPILVLIGVYRVSDILLSVIANVFYADVGFDKDQIANIAKSFGLMMTILGGFLGGTLALRYGVMPILFAGALLSAGTNLLFVLLAQIGPHVGLLTVVIAADNLSAGLAGAAFVAYLSSLTRIAFTASQYAIFSSLMTLIPKFLGGYSGTLVDGMGYGAFFAMTALMGVPVLALVWLANRFTGRLPHKSPGNPGTRA